MSDDLKNINDLFKDSFDGFKVDPNPGVWGNIENNVLLDQGANTFREAFWDFKVQPGTRVWNIIRRKLWFADFVSFNPLSFNIYYSGVAALMTGGILYYTTVFEEEIAMPEDSDKIAIVDTVENRPEDKFTNEAIIAYYEEDNPDNKTQPDLTGNIEPEEEITETDIVEETEDKRHREELVKNYEETTMKEEIPVKAVEEVVPVIADIKEEVPEDIGFIFVAAEENTEPETGDVEIKTGDPVSDEKTEELSDLSDTQINKDIEPDKIAEDINDNKITPENISQIKPSDTDSSGITEDPVIQADVPTEELPYPDTVGTDVFGNDIIIETTIWSVDIYYSRSGTWNTVSASIPENPEYVSQRNKTESPFLTYSVGANINCTFKNVLFQSGLSYTQLGEKFKHGIETVVIDSNYFYDYYQTEHYNVDTIWYTNLDSLLVNPDDPYVTPYYDTTIYLTNDSTLIANVDSTPGPSEYYESLNRYSYLEIPLLIGYEFKTDKVTLYLKGGVIAGIFLNAKGKSISLYDNNTVIDINNNNMPLAGITGSYIVGGGMLYHLNKKLDLSAEFYHRGNINSIFRKDWYVTQKYRSIGLRVGLRYCLR